ncbi:hypothetical protein KRX57_08530 [Weeksellaceae bacterium TAE3-ERU29]|nr:hypothetical protein [Weeksellaceae bacterium TAE3-ERU29]
MKNVIIILFLSVFCANIFAQSDNSLDNRCCEKITNEIIGCCTLTHRQDKNANIVDNPVDTDYCFMKDGTFTMMKSEEYFEGTWVVNSCKILNLLLKGKKPLMLSEELKYFLDVRYM